MSDRGGHVLSTRISQAYTAIVAVTSWFAFADASQHINRCHLAPIHCPRCGLVFETDLLMFAHVRKHVCHYTPFNHPGATPDQIKAFEKRIWVERNTRPELRKKLPGQNSDEKRWYWRYTILFPGAEELPNSPYMASEQVSEPVVHEAQSLLDTHPGLQLGDAISALKELESKLQTDSRHSAPPNVLMGFDELPMQLQPPHPVAQVPHHGSSKPCMQKPAGPSLTVRRTDLKGSIQQPFGGRHIYSWGITYRDVP